MTRATLRLYGRLLPFLRPHRSKLLLIGCVNLVSTLAGLAQPFLSKLLIDRALLGRDVRVLWIAAGYMLAAAALGYVLGILSSYWYVRVSAQALFDMRLAVYAHLQKLPPRYFARTKLGDIVSRLNNDIGEAQRRITDTLLSAASNTLFLIGSLVAMAMLNGRLFLLSVALVPVSVLTMQIYQKRMASQVKTMRERSSDIGSFLVETILGMRLVVASGTEDRETRRFEKLNGGFVRALLDMQLTSFLAGAMPGMILAASSAGIFLYGGKMVIAGALTVGSLVAFLAYQARLMSPVQSFMGTWSALLTGAVSLGRVFEVLDAPMGVTDSPGARPLDFVRGELEFRGVTFRHEPERALLEGVSFRVEAGTICAITGVSGSGKSTIADLILRFHDPQAGQVLLDGNGLREVTLESLRGAVALVDQSPFLFGASIEENIRYGRPDAERHEIVAAAKAASIHDFIESLPEGYETKVAERGATLSAGQRQRIAIARALLRKPRILVLDEPTAALDPAAEQEIAATLAGLMGGFTSIVISHRRSLVEAADVVLVLEEGRIVEQGAPGELMRRGGALWRHFEGRAARVEA